MMILNIKIIEYYKNNPLFENKDNKDYFNI